MKNRKLEKVYKLVKHTTFHLSWLESFNPRYVSFLVVVLSASCASLPKVISPTPKEPNYNELYNWAAHPELKDNADFIPNSNHLADQEELPADIFFVHPTTYTSKPIDDTWNAPIRNDKLNKATDASTIKYQASIFNKAGRVFAPRYRQAHLQTYYLEDEQLVQSIFDIAYSDVKRAFLHYLDNHNDNRPFIIASHSQGTTHTSRLIEELIDNKNLQNKLVVAYLIGMPVSKNNFIHVKPCIDRDDIGCFISWRTFKENHIPKETLLGDSIATHNPLSWKMDEIRIDKSLNKGAILRNFNKPIHHATSARVHNGILWASKPKFPFSFLFTRKNYHIADLNFFYFNIQENAAHRVQKFIEKN